MKVYIGPHTNWIGPYQIAQKLFFWRDHNDEFVHRVGNFFAHGFDKTEKKETWLYKLCNWIESKKKRKVKIRIDHYDTWGMDHTLALIALPMLKQLQESKHGSPFVDDEDVPEELRSTSAKPLTEYEKNNGYTDEHFHKRWDWVLNEMIHAFECKVDDSWDDQYWTGEWGDMESKETDQTMINPLTGKEEKLHEFVITGDRTCDWDARAKHQLRITNGFRLFGKYYEGLWD